MSSIQSYCYQIIIRGALLRLRVSFSMISVSLLIFAALCAGCTPSPAPTAESDGVVVAVKQLATVNIPPSPDAAQREATRRALPVSPTAPQPTATYTATPYIGVFLGTPNANDDGIPAVNAAAPTTVLDSTISGCPLPFDAAFGTGWQTNPSVARRIGCPLQQRFGFAGNVQVFERGVMYQRIDTREVWAIQPGSIGAGKFWYVNQPIEITAGGIEAPPGLRIPANAFGSVWLTNGEVSQQIGYATTPEQTADLNVQRFDGGSLLLDVTVGQIFILFDDGDAFGPYQS